MVFDRRWRKRLQEKHKGKSKYVTPYIVRLALDPRLSHEREKIEKWFQDLPEPVKPDVLERLRSERSQQHFGAYYELVTQEFFRKLGYSVEMHPSFVSEQPDMLVSGKGLDKPIVIEVATIFDDPEWEREDRKLGVLLDQLDRIRHQYLLGITVESTPIPERIEYDSLRSFVISWFDSNNPDSTERIETAQYDKDGLKLSLELYPKKPKFRKKKGPIIGQYGLPARFISNQQLRNALKQKASKYDFVKEQGYPYIVALSLYNTFSDNDDVVDQLFGKLVLTITRDAEGHVINEHWTRDSSSICKYNQNTRLSGVITIKSKGATYYPDILEGFIKSYFGKFLYWVILKVFGKPTKVHNFSLIRNRYASVLLNDDLMKGYPKFQKTEENANSLTYSWIDEQSNLPFDC